MIAEPAVSSWPGLGNIFLFFVMLFVIQKIWEKFAKTIGLTK